MATNQFAKIRLQEFVSSEMSSSGVLLSGEETETIVVNVSSFLSKLSSSNSTNFHLFLDLFKRLESQIDQTIEKNGTSNNNANNPNTINQINYIQNWHKRVTIPLVGEFGILIVLTCLTFVSKCSCFACFVLRDCESLKRK